MDVIGDITCDNPNFLFTIECKKHEAIDLEVLFLTRPANKNTDLISFWKQACSEAKRAEKQPLLVVEKKRGKPYAVLPRRVFERIISPTINEAATIQAKIHLSKETDQGWTKVTLLTLKDLLKHVIISKLFV